MKIILKRKKAFPLFFAKVPVHFNNVLVAELKNGEEKTLEGPQPEVIKFVGPGVVRTLEHQFTHNYEEVVVEFKIAMGFAAGGFKVKFFVNGEEVEKVRKTY